MTERRGTLGPPDDHGRRRLILPDGTMTAVTGATTDDAIKAEFGLDHIVHSPRVTLSPSGGICLDGPAAGLTLDYVTNELGATAADFTETLHYRVTALGDAHRPAELRHLPDGPEGTDRVTMHVRLTRD